jgi:hypothetical protein
MPAGTVLQTKTLDKVLVLAKAIAGIGNDRAFQGYKRWADGENLGDLVRALTPETQGYFFCSLKAAGTANDTSSDAPEQFDIVGELHVAIAKDSSSDLNLAWELALSLSAALANPANYTTGTMGIPLYNRFTLLNIDVVEKGGIAVFDFGRYGSGVIKFLDP